MKRIFTLLLVTIFTITLGSCKQTDLPEIINTKGIEVVYLGSETETIVGDFNLVMAQSPVNSEFFSFNNAKKQNC